MLVPPTITATRSDSDPGPVLDLGTSGRRIGDYQVVAPLGHGGMGRVYRGYPIGRPHSPVAIKVISNDRGTQLRALKREYRLMSGFRHPNFVHLFDLYADEDVSYLVMELVAGSDFVSYVRQNAGALEDAACQLVEAVFALHQSRRLHRDLKPSNVLVEGATGRVVILDFGLVEVEGGEPLRRVGLLGTPQYMSPELFEGAAPSEASDWYAVGRMLSEALTEHGAGEDGPAPVSAGRVGRDVLGEVVASLLHPNPTARPSGEDVMRRLGLESARDTWAEERLFGRDAELAACWGAWRGGHVSVEILGEPGVGKTTLAHVFLDQLQDTEDVWILRSRCIAGERIAFNAADAVVESLGSLADFQDDDFWAEIDVEAPALAARLFPALRSFERFREANASALLSGAELRARAIEALHRIIACLSRRRRIVLFVDDLHWGDKDSAQVFAPLFHGSAMRTVLLWTRRLGRDDSPFFDELRRLCPEALGEESTTISLAPLSEPATFELASAWLGLSSTPDDIRALASETGGNPLLIRQATLLARSGVFEARAFSLQHAVEVQMGALVDAERDVVALLAIASVPVRLATAFDVVGELAPAAQVLASLRHSSLVTVSSDRRTHVPGDDRVCLYHDRLREPLLQMLLPERRTDLHLALAQHLANGSEASAATLALHFAEGGDRPRAAVFAERAADEAASSLAFHAASGHYRDAIAWTEGTDEIRSQLHERLGDALFNAGLCAEAGLAYRTAAATGVTERRSELHIRALKAWFSAGRLSEAIAGAAPLMAMTGLRRPARATAILAVMWRVAKLRLSRDVENILKGGQSSSSTPEPESARARVAWTLGMGWSMFQAVEGAYFALESLAFSARVGDVRGAAKGLAFAGGLAVNLGPLFSRWGHRCLDKAEQIALESEDSRLLGWCAIWRANSELLGGNWVDAVRIADHATVLMEERSYGMTWECNTARCFATMALERAGRLREVARRAEAIVTAATARSDLYGRIVFSLTLAWCKLLAGETNAARTLARESLDMWTTDAYTIQHFYALRILIYCDLYDGNRLDAEKRLATEWPELRRSDVFGLPSAKLDALLLRSQVRRKSDRAIARTLGREGHAHAEFVAAWFSRSSERAQAAADAFDELGMAVWSAIAAAYCGDASAIVRLRAAGVQDPVRWLAVVAPQPLR